MFLVFYVSDSSSTSYGQSTNATPNTATGNSNSSITANLENLNSNTTYHYRVKAVSEGGTTYGNDMNFTTIAIPAPSATTSVAANVSYTTATVNGSVNANGFSTSVTFEYGFTTSYGMTASATPATVTGISNTSVAANLLSRVLKINKY